MNIEYPGCAPDVISSEGLDKYVGDRVFCGQIRRTSGRLDRNSGGDYVLVRKNGTHVQIIHGDAITLQTGNFIRSYVFNETE